MAYNPAQWDSLALDNDNIYAMLQRAANPSALTLDPTRFPAPAVDNPTPPASDDSSPSPPSIKEREQFNAASNSAGRATRRSTVAEDESSKRKVDDISDSDDSSYEQPSKHQHRSSESGVGASGPRRSTGGTKKKGGNPDENRALKRKEQNRAAQRAFRERKEKHVKELEDQVAALEARSNNQDRENENLRDLLGRLQNENLLLKQSAFTFSFPSGSGSGSTPGATANNTASPSSIAGPSAANRGGVPSPKMSSPSSSDASTPENTASGASDSNTTNNPPQSSLFARPSATPIRPGAGPGGVNGSNSSLSSDAASEPSSSRFLSSPGAFGLGHNLPSSAIDPFSGAGGGLDFGFGTDLNLLGMHNPTSGIGGNTKTVNSAGITTIAANPMYMSFGDPVMDPMAWASFGPGDYTSPTSAVGGGGASDLDIFGVSPYGASNGVAVNAAGRTGSTSEFSDLFGGAPTTGTGVTPSFLDFSGIGVSPSATGTAAGSSSAGGGTYSSPSEVNTDLSGAAQPPHDDGSGETCPKTVAEVQAMQKLLPASTFGPPVTVRSPSSSLSQPSPPHNLQPQQSPSSSSSIPQLSPSHTRSTSPAASLPQRTPDEKDHACAHARMAALCADLPRTTKKPNQIEIGRAWEKIRQHAGFEECDIDELCNELSAKARCDGSRPVLEESSFNNIVMSLGSVYKRA